MAYAVTLSPNSLPEAGSGVATGLPTATPEVLVGTANGISLRERQGMLILCNVACTGAFNLDYEFSPDDGATWYVGQQIASTTVTVDGATAGYTQVASMNIEVGYRWRVTIYQSTGSDKNFVYEYRYYSDSG
jgi:hypothetical protein